MRNWPVPVTAVDLAWGTAVTATVAILSSQVSSRVLWIGGGTRDSLAREAERRTGPIARDPIRFAAG